jgi:hypothetical protein
MIVKKMIDTARGLSFNIVIGHHRMAIDDLNCRCSIFGSRYKKDSS